MAADIGVFYTPLPWARWALNRFQIYEKWRRGARIWDPTCGEGVFFEALLGEAAERGEAPSADDLGRLGGRERDEEALNRFRRHRPQEASLMDLRTGDILRESPLPRVDILVGNPPWINFCDLPPAQQEEWKPLFLKRGMAASAGELLWGRSRMDLAALVVLTLFQEMENSLREALFFLPQSLLFSTGAHDLWRQKIEALLPMTDYFETTPHRVFSGVNHSHGLVRFAPPKTPRFWQADPLTADLRPSSGSPPRRWQSRPLHQGSTPGATFLTAPLPPFTLPLERRNQPRQGLNTGGANKIYFFTQGRYSRDTFHGINGEGEAVALPAELVYPLLTKKQFAGHRAPEKWVFLPHNPSSGKPLTPEELPAWPRALAYLTEKRELLINRRGTLMGSLIKRGLWGALLGVGVYSFAPWKVVWEAYGRNRFTARVFRGRWQANQALQAFIPCGDREEAQAIAGIMNRGELEEILLAQRGEGSRNWAQPGKILPWVTWKREDSPQDG